MRDFCATYEPGSRGFQVLPGAPFFNGLERKTRSSFSLWDLVEPLIHRSARTPQSSRTWRPKPSPPLLPWDPVGPLIPTSALAVGDAQHRPCTPSVEQQVRLFQQVANIGARVMTGH